MINFCSNADNSITPPKTTNSYRTINLDIKSIELLNEFKRAYVDFDGFDDDKFIFGFYKPLSTSTLSRNYKRYQEIADVKKIRFHDLRHSHASLLINKNMPLTAVADRLGDNIETILNTYTHLFETSNKEVMDLLNNL